MITVGLGMFYSLQANVSNLEIRISGIQKSITSHISNNSVHIPYEESVRRFVPRTEVDLRFDVTLEEIRNNRIYAQEYDAILVGKMEKMEKSIEEMKKILYRLEASK